MSDERVPREERIHQPWAGHRGQAAKPLGRGAKSRL